jgi:hypothetical protein
LPSCNTACSQQDEQAADFLQRGAGLQRDAAQPPRRTNLPKDMSNALHIEPGR